MAKFVVEYKVQVVGELLIEAETPEEAAEKALLHGPMDYVSWDNIEAVRDPDIRPTYAHIASPEEIAFREERIARNRKIG